MTRQDLAAALQLSMPGTDISTVNYPVEAITIKLVPWPANAKRLFIPMQEVGDLEGDEAVAFVRARFDQRVDELTKVESNLRHMTHMPNMPSIVRERALALLSDDRAIIARLHADLKHTQASAEALAAALGETL